MRVDPSLYGDDASRFEELRERYGEESPGTEPSRPEFVRVMMDVFEDEILANDRRLR
jgi:hypothetical protein